MIIITISICNRDLGINKYSYTCEKTLPIIKKKLGLFLVACQKKKTESEIAG